MRKQHKTGVIIGMALSAVAGLILMRPKEPTPASAESSSQPAAPPQAASPPAAAMDLPTPASVKSEINEESAKPDFAKIAAFDGWLERWATSAPQDREALADEGAKLAEARRPEFKSLIISDPAKALEMAAARALRQDLPETISKHLEIPVSAKGNYSVSFGRGLEEGSGAPESHVARSFATESGFYRVFPAGAMAEMTSRSNFPARGVSIDGLLAVAENAVRRLEVGERIPAGAPVTQVCPVSGDASPAEEPVSIVTPATPVVELAGELIELCQPAHVPVFEGRWSTWAQAAGLSSSDLRYFNEKFPGSAAAASIGHMRVLYIRGVFPDALEAPNTEARALSDLAELNRYYEESSYGKLTLTSTLAPMVTLPKPLSYYALKERRFRDNNVWVESDQNNRIDSLNELQKDARTEATRLGYDVSAFDCVILRVASRALPKGVSWGGGGPGGPSSVWAGSNGMDLLGHECGHAFGLNHAKSWLTTGGNPYSPVGRSEEYGNPYDKMGRINSGPSGHYNTISKLRLAWLNESHILRPAASGVFRLHAYDQPRLEPGKYNSLVTPKGAASITLEYHPAIGQKLERAALVLYSNMAAHSNAGHLIDANPVSGYPTDYALRLGATFSDQEADAHYTVINADQLPAGSQETRWIDVEYNQGTGPSNQHSPLIDNNVILVENIAAQGSNPAETMLTVNATDADGDSLAYYWECDDGLYFGGAAVYRRPAPARRVMIMVTVSDKKGRVAKQNVVVNGGVPRDNVISGVVAYPPVGANAANPVAYAAVVAHNSGIATSRTWTDAQGAYSLPDVANAGAELAVVLPGHTFGRQADGPNARVVNWTGNTPQDVVTVESTVGAANLQDAAEGSANRRFYLKRSGGAAALAVSVAVSGTASAEDYSFAPQLAGSVFTIPANSNRIEIEVRVTNDQLVEGLETIKLRVVDSPLYRTGEASSAEINLREAGSLNLPAVSVESPDATAQEGPAGGPVDNGAFVFTRTGAINAALEIGIDWTGATGDFAALPARITVPAGQRSFRLDVEAINDAIPEAARENLTATIRAEAAYVVNTGKSSASVSLADDDAPVVTIAVVNPEATEGAGGSGVLAISRTGPLDSSLRVYYSVGGAALPGVDYEELSGEVMIAAGAEKAYVVISPRDDSEREGDEKADVILTSFENAYTVGTARKASVTLRDQADLPSISVRAARGTSENAGPAKFYISASGPTGQVLNVDYALSGATPALDYVVPASQNINIRAGTEVEVPIALVSDNIREGAEILTMTIAANPAFQTPAGRSASILIFDAEDRTKTIGVAAGNLEISEAGASNQSFFHIYRAGYVNADMQNNLILPEVRVSYTVQGTASPGQDFNALNGEVTIPANTFGVDVALTAINDLAVEGEETVTVTISDASVNQNYAKDISSSATITILDNDAPAAGAAVVEAGFRLLNGGVSEPQNGDYIEHNIEVTLSADPGPGIPVEVTVVAAAGAGANERQAVGGEVDWCFVDANNNPQPRGVVRFPAGANRGLSANLRLRIFRDAYSEAPETFFLELLEPAGAALSKSRAFHQVWIHDGPVPVDPGFVADEIWLGATDLSDAVFAGNPSRTIQRGAFVALTNIGDNFARRLSGSFVAPVAGNYFFSVSSDDNSELYLSPPNPPAGALADGPGRVLAARVRGWMNPRDYTSNAESTTAAVALQAGDRLNIALRHREVTGGDHASVAWRLAGPSGAPVGEFQEVKALGGMVFAQNRVRFISGSSTHREGSAANPQIIAILDAPAASEVSVGYAVSGSADAPADHNLGNGRLQFAAGQQQAVLPLAVAADAAFEMPESLLLALENPTGLLLAEPFLHAASIVDGDSPAVAVTYASASRNAAPGSAVVSVLAESARPIASWEIVAGNPQGVFGINRNTGEITLLLPAQLPLLQKSQLIVRATDSAGSAADGSVYIIPILSNAVTHEVLQTDWTSHLIEGPEPPSEQHFIGQFDLPLINNPGPQFNRRLYAWVVPPATGDYSFAIASSVHGILSLSGDEKAFNKRQIATSLWGAVRGWDGSNSSQPVRLEQGKAYFMEARNFANVGGNHLSVAWRRPGAAVWELIPAANLTGYDALQLPSPAPTPPTARLSYAVNSGLLRSGNTMVLSAEVYAGAQIVTSVEFYNGASLIGADVAAPYSTTWADIPAGLFVWWQRQTNLRS
jgi:hypothetical protein